MLKPMPLPSALQSQHGDLHRALADAQPLAHFDVRDRARFAHKKNLQLLKALPAARLGEFQFQPVKYAFEQRHGPAALEQLGGIEVVGEFREVAVLGVLMVELDELRVAAAFLGLLLVAFVGEEVLQRHEQEGAELPLLPLHAAQGVLLHQVQHEALGQILSVRRRFPLSPQISIERKPIRAAERGEGFVGLRGGVLARQQHDAPQRRRKPRSRSKGVWFAF